MATTNTMDRLAEVAHGVRTWCRERGLATNPVTLHVHRKWLPRMYQDMTPLQVAEHIFEAPPLMLIGGLHVASDGVLEDLITVTVARTDENDAYMGGYEGLPLDYPWEAPDDRA